MDALMKKKRVLKRNLNRLITTWKQFAVQKTLDIENLSKFESALNEYRSNKQKLDNTIEEMFILADETDSKFPALEKELITDLNEASEFLHYSEGKIHVFHKLLSTEESRHSLVPSALNSSFVAQSAPKLEKIKVPTFNGNILEWLNFKGLFENLVHTNNDLSNVQKLHYLKEAMIDDAKVLLRDFDLKEEAYATAWSFLLSKFDNPRSIIRAQFRKLHDLEPIKNESEIRQLLNNVDVIVNGLKSAGEKVDELFSRYLTYHITRRLDIETAKDFDNSLTITTTKTFPLYDQLQKFLQNRVFNTDDRAADFKSIKHTKESKGPYQKKQPDKKPTVSAVASKIKCVVCSDAHFLNQCPAFAAKSVNDRFDIVKRNRLCIKCFNPHHGVTECKRNNCSSCGGRHNYMLHRETKQFNNSSPTSIQSTNAAAPVEPANSNNIVPKTVGMGVTCKREVVLMSTAVIFILVAGKRYLARIFFDGGSETCLATRSLVKRFKLPIFPAEEPTALIGINDTTKVIDQVTSFTLKSRFSDFEIDIQAEIVDRIPYRVPNEIFKVIETNLNFEFAECQLSYSDIDIVIGAKYCERLMTDERHFIDSVVLRKSQFGFVISGAQPKSVGLTTTYCGLSRFEIDKQLEKFWEIEELASDNSTSSTDAAIVEKHFEETHLREPDGRFVVRLPKKSSINCLNGSFNKALRIFLKTEKRRSVTLNFEYLKFMKEYEQLGHMRKLSSNEIASDGYYIPHHIVEKPSSTTTKFRVVFNASAVDNSLTSLNDHLMVGPVLQSELFDTVVRFRNHRIAFCADIEKMYRQVMIHPDDRKYQRILHRDNPSDPIAHYELNTVTYGTSPASYLATKCLQIVANEIDTENSVAAAAIKRDFYMDDFMSGANSIEDAVQLQQIVHRALASAKFPLRKYQSNSAKFLSYLDSCLVEKTNSRLLGSESFVHVLGLMWFTNNDCFRVILNTKPLPSIITKRVVLSDISRVFDVLGILTPVTIRGKLLLQELWRQEADWDDPLSEEFCGKFIEYRDELMLLENFSLVRPYCVLNNVVSQKMIGFCDASLQAYCAVIYIWSVDNLGNKSVLFVCAKSHVAPVKKVLTIPRLELLAALSLARIIDRIARDLNFEMSNLICFSDSSIVLSWLKLSLTQLKQFVANRVEIINNLVELNCWNHVAGQINPADLGTRGLSANNLLCNNTWLSAPDCIESLIDNCNVKLVDSSDLPELRKTKVNLLTVLEPSILNLYSSYEKLINVTAYIWRFVNNCTKVKLQRNFNVLPDIEERNLALNSLIKVHQNQFFSYDINRILTKNSVKKGRSIFSLDPFLDDNGILRVGGRIRNADLPYNKRFPIILHAKCNFVRLLIRSTHEKLFHCSKDVILSYLGNLYLFVGGINNAIKKVLRQCILCIRLRAVTNRQIMGQLPKERLEMSRPFTNVRVDFTGHFTVKCLGHRSVKFNKAYAAFFVCMSTRAIHIELVSELSTEKFVAALNRFVSRRGLPNTVFSDNATNFVGANNWLDKINIERWSNERKINWKFIVPRSPHQGGIWESAIKSGKSLLLKGMQKSTVTFEELATILCQVEAILNSRPLCYQREIDQRVTVLTPGHFLIVNYQFLLACVVSFVPKRVTTSK